MLQYSRPMKLAGAYINDDTYEALVALATKNNRTLAGQCRHLFANALAAEAAPMPSAKIAKVLAKNSTKKGRA